MGDFMNPELKRFNYLWSEIDAAYHGAALKLGLSDAGMSILYTICNYGDKCPLNDIIRLSGICKQTVNSALRKLESDGIVYLESFHGRRKIVCLTEKGKVFVKNTVFHVIQIENEIFDSWTEEELEVYMTLVEKYLRAFEAEIEKLPLQKG